MGGLWTIKAIEAVKGKVEDKGALMKDLHEVKLAGSPHGPLSSDKFGRPVQNMYVRKVEKGDGKYQNSAV